MRRDRRRHLDGESHQKLGEEGAASTLSTYASNSRPSRLVIDLDVRGGRWHTYEGRGQDRHFTTHGRYWQVHTQAPPVLVLMHHCTAGNGRSRRRIELLTWQDAVSYGSRKSYPAGGAVGLCNPGFYATCMLQLRHEVVVSPSFVAALGMSQNCAHSGLLSFLGSEMTAFSISFSRSSPTHASLSPSPMPLLHSFAP